jgi:hypothetical protein
MGRDIHELLTMFKGNEAVGKVLCFRLLWRMFGEQCSLEPAGVTDDPWDSGEAVVVRIKDPKEVP